MTVPSSGDTFSKLIHHIGEAQREAAMLSHLYHAEYDNGLKAQQWLKVSEMLKRMIHQLTDLAKGTIQ